MNDALYDNSEGGVDDYLSGADSAVVEADIAKAKVSTHHKKSPLKRAKKSLFSFKIQIVIYSV